MSKCKWVDGELISCRKWVDGINGVIDANIIKKVKIAYCPFCGESLKKPIKIEAGMFGYFWDDVTSRHEYGILSSIIDGCQRFSANKARYYQRFKPGLPEGFNQDGTLKRPNAWRDGSERL